ncbi:MAG: hypothetical protein WC384_01965 [Prolixibacteraceae bacterium]|jgi:hypothetical protein
MIEKELHELIDDLNSNPDSSKFILIQIAEDIYFAKVWLNLPWENQIEYHGDNFYFINRPDYGFIGVVEASSNEMHAYLIPEFRGKGIICSSLSETILPHSFWYNKMEKQRVTIDQSFHGKNFKKVEKSLLLAGFKDKSTIVDSLFEYFAYKNDFAEFKYFKAKEKSFSEKEFQFLYNRINSIIAQLQYMKERYELVLNEDDEIVSSIHDSIRQFEGIYDKKLRSLL